MKLKPAMFMSDIEKKQLILFHVNPDFFKCLG